MQSGTGICAFAHQNFARNFAFMLGRALDPKFISANSTDLLNLLQSKTASDIMLTEIIPPSEMESEVGKDHDGLIWIPVIEREQLPGAFITGPMHEDVKNGNINKVSTLLGFNSQEWINSSEYNKTVVEELALFLDENLNRLINNNFKMDGNNSYIAGGKLRDIYTNGEKFQDHLGSLVKFMSDVKFTTPTIREAVLQANYSDVYLYQFSYLGPLGQFAGVIPDVDDLEVGVPHASDTRYMWSDSRNYDVYEYPITDILAHKRLLKLWNPTPEADVLLQNVIWPKVSPDNIKYLNIDTTLEVKEDPKEYKKFKEVIDTYAIPPLINY
ncbi:hypothetical protein NQ314_020289 [Rhamnusium bicolor]|uniref:Carboxylesterase type B domain-containing protein n=1 Tax=Rhamnusium bicolor TaxID=1586634 RepID=A0AAV8WLE4_9CUCU|nr:hypothetical protein NQ314_020289 [Rhamnusium bicolor]